MLCNEKLSGRIDKKFCSSYCRTQYHNNKNKLSADPVRKIDAILKRNRKILAELNPAKKTVVTKHSLMVKGFSFKYYTSEYLTDTGNIYNFCYDYGYSYIGNQKYLLVRNKKLLQLK
jgi:hypothetical protein